MRTGALGRSMALFHSLGGPHRGRGLRATDTRRPRPRGQINRRGDYIDIQLTKAFRKHRQAYRKGLADIDIASRAMFGSAFADLPADRRSAILRDVERNSRPFFELILAHARQGFYGDPRHGGNRNRASWKMVGLDVPPVRGRQHYEGA